jgi:hypothetical protein
MGACQVKLGINWKKKLRLTWGMVEENWTNVSWDKCTSAGRNELGFSREKQLVLGKKGIDTGKNTMASNSRKQGI